MRAYTYTAENYRKSFLYINIEIKSRMIQFCMHARFVGFMIEKRFQ